MGGGGVDFCLADGILEVRDSQEFFTRFCGFTFEHNVAEGEVDIVEPFEPVELVTVGTVVYSVFFTQVVNLVSWNISFTVDADAVFFDSL